MKKGLVLNIVAASLLALMATGCSDPGTAETSTKAEAAPAASPEAQPAQPAQPAPPTEIKTRGGEKATIVSVAGPNAPKLLVPLKRIDFGKQPQGKSLTRTLLIKNVGKSELQIADVQPSCGCTAVDFPRVLKAGNVGKIKVKLDTGSSPGEHVKKVTILSNDPASPSVVVDLVVNVK